MLADLVRTDRDQHRPVAGDSELAEAVKVLARSHQNLCWMRGAARRTCCAPRCASSTQPRWRRSTSSTSRDALAVLEIAPTPDRWAGAVPREIAGSAAPRPAGNATSRAAAEQIQTALRSPQLEQPPLVADAFGARSRAYVTLLATTVAQIATLEGELEASFGQHPAAEIVLSQPGLGTILGARVLAEFGDDPDRYATAKARKNYAGTTPITRASGTRRVVLARYRRQRPPPRRPHLQAFAALTASPGARAYYDTHRAAGAGHHQALRALANRLVGILHGCLRHDTPTTRPPPGPAPTTRPQPGRLTR